MFALEYKQLFIPREELTKNRSFQGYRWKQYALLSEFMGLRKTKFGYAPVEIKRPPQSWCYVEDLA